MPDEDLGNPGSWWRPYVGKYELVITDGVTMEDTTVMLSTIQDVIFTADMSIAEGVGAHLAQLAMLPPDCIPDRDVYLGAVMESDGALAPAIVKIDTSGGISVPASPIGSFILHLYGLSFNICGNYYREEV